MTNDALGSLHRRDLVLRLSSGGITFAGREFKHINAEEVLKVDPSTLPIAVCLGRRVALQVLEIAEQTRVPVEAGR